jgi:hypothetical protein
MLVVTRFTNETWKNNKDYRRKKNLECIYGSPSILFKTKLLHCKKKKNPFTDPSFVYVIEMNIEENQIEGIGYVATKTFNDHYCLIYPTIGNYNRFIYIGNYHLNREQLLANNETMKTFVEQLETVLFSGKAHLKRGNGFTSLTDKVLKRIDLTSIMVLEKIQACFQGFFPDKL